MPPVPPLKEWSCRKCNAPQRGGQVCKDCGASKRLNGGERRKAERAEAVRQAQLAGNLWGAVEPPPITQGTEAVIEWLNVVNVAIDRAIEVDFPDAQKVRVLQDLVKAITKGKHKENAPAREKLLQLRQQREGVPYVELVTGDAPPSGDLMALPLYYFFRLARAIYEAAQVPEMDDEVARKFRARATTATAGIYLREQHRAEALLEEHGVRDVHRAAREEQRIWPVIETEGRPAAPGVPVLFTANPGPQSRFVESTVDELLYGGAAGGGKSAGLLIAAIDHLLRYPDPKNHAIIFRRTLTETRRQSYYKLAQIELGKLQRRGYPVRWRGDQHVWELDGYGLLEFGYLDSMDDAIRYQGCEFCFVGIDEATHIAPEPLEYLTRTRMRKAPHVPALVRYATNPGGPHHSYFFQAFAPWVNRRPNYLQAAQLGTVPVAQPGEVLWFIVEGGKDRWVPEGTARAKSRTYLPASVKDTPQYDVEDYQRQLDSIRDPLLREQLQNGDWSAEYAAGEVFRRDWFRLTSTVPGVLKRTVRSWDMAWGTSESACWTVGTLLGELESGDWIVLDVLRLRGSEGTTRPVVRQVAELDGRQTIVRLPADMGLAGAILRDDYVRELAGYDVRLVPDKGDKFERARPFAAQVEHGHVWILTTSHPTRELAAEMCGRGVECSTAYTWIDGFLKELEDADPRYPKRGFVDQMDSVVGAFEFLHQDRCALPPPGAMRGAGEAAQRAFGLGGAASPAASWSPAVGRGGRRAGVGMI